jgi:hypothetical protein
MDRKKYLELCQRVAVQREEIPADLLVSCDGVKYIPTAYKLWFDKEGISQHTAILKDYKSNTILCAELEKVKYEPSRSDMVD